LILFNKKQTMFRVVYEQIADEPIPWYRSLSYKKSQISTRGALTRGV
jgi:hypothetical protein